TLIEWRGLLEETLLTLQKRDSDRCGNCHGE
ncbi:MAG: hypothetical protein ACI9C9_001581, partial [Marivirga sp.]